MLTLKIDRPIKTDTRYEFGCRVLEKKTFSQAAKQCIKGLLGRSSPTDPGGFSIGFESLNFKMRHSDVWDSVYPLMFLARPGGPFFKERPIRAKVIFKYPILRKAVEYFTNEARGFGIDLDVRARLYDRIFSESRKGCALGFSGGKDSRLALGLLREVGEDPLLFNTVDWASNGAPDQASCLRSRATNFSLTHRLMPVFMSDRERLYFGGDLFTTIVQTPWPAFHNLSPVRLSAFSDFMRSLGVPISCAAPNTVLPSNLTQKILHDRYPDLFRHQYSVRQSGAEAKNFSTAIRKLCHGLSFADDCTEDNFKALLRKYVDSSLGTGESFYPDPSARYFSLERNVLAYRLRHNPLFREVADKIPSSWDAAWVDGMHPYLDPAIDPRFMEVLRQCVGEASEKVPFRYEM